MIKKIRKRHGETLAEMAKKLNMSMSPINNYERKGFAPNHVIDLIIERYELTTKELQALKKMKEDNDNIICVDLRKLSPKRRENVLLAIGMNKGKRK